MKKNELKLFLGNKIVESKMSKDSKMQLLKFVQYEAKEYQLMAMALDGGIVKLDEQAQQIVIDRFRVSSLNEGLTSGERELLFGKIHRMFGACAKKCGRIAISSEARLCRKKCESDRDKATLQARVKAKQAKMAAKGKTAALAKSQAKVAGR